AFISADTAQNWHASDAELRTLLDGARRRWPLPDTLDDDPQTRALLGKVLLFQRHLGHIARVQPASRAPVDLTLWWSGRAPHRPAAESAAMWQARVAGRVTQAGSIDADHQGIVRHRDLFEALARELRASLAQAAWLEATR
ncbi:MAG: hypothetical protein V4793_48120, partial [Paraburkholderia tropica]